MARDAGPVCLIEPLELIDPALTVPASGSELTRLFTNLLENAVRHTSPEGTVTVSALVDATSVTVTVRDTGEGIAPEHLSHLGARFYRVDAARSGGAGGAGLGLAICRRITDAHGGQLTMEANRRIGLSDRGVGNDHRLHWPRLIQSWEHTRNQWMGPLMSEHIEIELDQQGRLVFSSPLAARLGLGPGTRLVAEQDNAKIALRIEGKQPRLVEKQGVLVVEPEVTTNLDELVRNEREKRAMDLVRRMSQ